MPILLSCVILFLIWFYIRRKKVDKESKNNSEFWDRERLAQSAPKRSTADINYITLPVSELPFGILTDSETAALENKLQKLAVSPIADLSQYTNTELKLRYGASNFDALSIADNNYTVLLRSLVKWGRLFYEKKLTKEAETVYKYTIQLGSNDSVCFTHLSEIYAAEHDSQAVMELISLAKEFSAPGSRLLVNLNKIFNDCLVSEVHVPE